ncbi:hypothetical protein T439DRAFT_327039 [Meredithblackwellia eburnea MCA 4105]
MVYFKVSFVLALLSIASVIVANPVDHAGDEAPALVERGTFVPLEVESSNLEKREPKVVPKRPFGGGARNFKRDPSPKVVPKRPFGGGARNFKRDPSPKVVPKRPFGGGARNFA